jgi:cytosine/adenosine deaminase-related metal-dependent hydrolase
LAFGKNILKEFESTPGKPFVIHAAEGIDLMASEEIDKLDKLGVLKSNTVLVHAVALAQNTMAIIAARNCSVVWCPESNNFLFHKTADIHSLKKLVRVALGSDSTLTGSAVMLDEMRSAHATGLASPREIFEMSTVRASDIYNIDLPSIAQDTVADLMVVPRLHDDYYENLLQIHPSHIEAVFINGIPRYGDEKINDALKLKHSFRVQGVKKYSTLDVSSLLKKLEKKPGPAILQSNPLWNMLTPN